MIFSNLRKTLIHYGKQMLTSGLTTGSGGNLSMMIRTEDRVLITPSGVAYADMKPEDIVVLTGRGDVVECRGTPSSETGFHLALYDRRPDISAVVHTHSPYATTYACLNREIPAVHYLVGFAGNRVPLAPYATYGTQALADSITANIGNYNAILLANHGLVSVGTSLLQAFNTAEEIELVARLCFQAEAIGTPVILPDSEMETVIKKFQTYGPKEDDYEHTS